ncbi:NAD(P)-dependent dehydrogenase, short-chain alcohol dehydrogenase family [Lentibacillus halodurans]|uniref:NAD(P)-dependent dehydrogenase, short-chain alcohol dehydrogenase family n=1 Tax=Lentibacillus halodurans TaxID=237679 RepID=A0A1I1A5B7_9BACI|nr:SDR family NAD(P)-dependent oxidoreductase [Lentibacillus halodurans]SFB32712.1 NAD(P)-dependent dehydrogenase, short-chain alcohol dehydrogenase family [Lentibacillus halodurans]
MAKFAGKTVLITGGAGGIGKKTAELFLKEGASVSLVDMNQDALHEVKSDLDQYGDVMIVKANVTNEDDVKNYVHQTVDKFGTIDVFFNNAGIEGEVAPIVEQTDENFSKVLSVNVQGSFLGLKHVLPVMAKQKSGSVINTSSVAGLDGSPGVAPYIASKHAVTGLTKTAALEAAQDNVRVNSIHPSPVNTRMMRSLEKGFNPENAEQAKTEQENAIPLGRYGESADIAKLVLFLASDDSSFITGSQYRIDGGMGAQ